MLILNAIIGLSTDDDLHERLHDLSHRGTVETIRLEQKDMLRRRLRAETDKRTVCAIALPRDRKLEDGAVLLIEEGRAIIVRAAEEHWLRLQPRDAAAALELGYHAGNMHWRVRFDGAVLAIAQEGPRKTYLDRLEAYLADGRAKVLDDG